MLRLNVALGVAALCAAACDPNVYVGHERTVADAHVSALPWEAHHEDGTLNEWLADGFGSSFNEGEARLEVSTEIAHGGRYALVATIEGSGDLQIDQAVVWREVELESGTYSAWYYFPELVLTGNWVIMKFSGEDDRFDLDVHSEGDGMRLRLWEHDDVGWITEPAAVELPVGAWVHVEVDVIARPDSGGRLTVRQDGRQILDTGGRPTFPDQRVRFFVGTASFYAEPIPARVFIDDVGIFPNAD